MVLTAFSLSAIVLEETEVDPILGGTRTWKSSPRKFIFSDEKRRKDNLFIYTLIIPLFNSIVNV